ncbi:alpha/beta hydrolase [Azospirillum sp. A39]|uniref:alpha/beta hydrolase n=1 Tax=Azospirillum sp. A39 TaxID=3462279 RepID=UPI0040451E5A
MTLRTRLSTLLLAALSLLPLAVAGRGAAADTGRRVETFDLRSGRTGENYRIFLVRPAVPAPPGGHPVIYLLDGNATVPMMEAARESPAMAAFRDAVIVGVGYPVDGPFDVVRRYRDLTPPTPPELMPPLRDGGAPPATGGEDDFLAFLETGVRPAVEARVPVDRGRQTLFGHSLAGRFVLHVLFTRGALFQTYVAADPSVWWNGRSILGEMAAFLDRARTERTAISASLLIETSGRKAQRPDVAAETAERLIRLRSGENGRDVAAALAGVPGLTVSFRTFAEETHGGMLPLAVADALPFAFGRAPMGSAAP